MAPRWRTLPDGRRVLINDGGPGKGTAAAVAIGMVLASGGLSGGVAGTSVGASATARTVQAGKADAKRAARSRNADQAWRRIGMRRLRQTSNKRSLGCVKASFGQVQEFLVRRPCASLDRILFAIADRRGNTVLVSVSWVRFRAKGRMRDFKRLIDVYGTGDIKPLGAGLLDMADVHFTARYYHSVAHRSRLTVAETEPVKGSLDPKTLDTIAQIAAHLPGPPTRRR